MSGTMFLAISWLGVVLFGGLAIDLLARDFCLVGTSGDTVVVYLPFGLHRVLKGYRFAATDHPNLQVRLTNSASDARVRVEVLSEGRTLRSFSVPAMKLDQATRSKSITASSMHRADGA
jgi:hypothetical protein